MSAFFFFHCLTQHIIGIQLTFVELNLVVMGRLVERWYLDPVRMFEVDVEKGREDFR